MKLPWRKPSPRDSAPWAWIRWCQIALNQVGFYPDRREIEKELLAHLEDSRDRMVSRGYEPKEAAERALTAMGDAWTVGEALNRAHHPLWGWIWKASQGLLILLGVYAVLLLYGDVNSSGGLRESTPVSRTLAQIQASPIPQNAKRIDAGDYTIWYDPVLTTAPSQEAYTVWSGPDVEFTLAAPGEWYTAELRFWVEKKPWTGAPNWIRLLEPSDQTGPLTGVSLYQAAHGAGYTSTEWGGWTRSAFTYTIGLLHEPDFLELRYPFGDSGLVLRADGAEHTEEGAAS